MQSNFWAGVDKSGDGCWEWQMATDRGGYGRCTKNWTGEQLAHRAAWVLTNGPIPKGMHVLHHCDNRKCCRIDHLWIGNNALNVADKVAKGRQSSLPGESHPLHKLTAEQVIAIHGDTRPVSIIAKEYGIHRTTVGYIKRGETWASVTGGKRGSRSIRKSFSGESHPGAKIGEQEVRKILADSRTLREISAEYGISIPTVSCIKRRVLWKHLEV